VRGGAAEGGFAAYGETAVRRTQPRPAPPTAATRETGSAADQVIVTERPVVPAPGTLVRRDRRTPQAAGPPRRTPAQAPTRQNSPGPRLPSHGTSAIKSSATWSNTSTDRLGETPVYNFGFGVAPNSPGDGANDILSFIQWKLWRSADSGQTWVRLTDSGNFHDDYHVVASAPAT
jgi:hypothetical protein